jgi:hypothetical protein
MVFALVLLHTASAAVLFLSHGGFLFRGLAIESGRTSPGRLDHLARTLSQVLLPVTALSGLILLLYGGGRSGGAAPRAVSAFVPHLVLGFAPLAAIPLVFFGRVILKKRRQAPWLLPALNLVLIAAALATGLWLRRYIVYG